MPKPARNWSKTSNAPSACSRITAFPPHPAATIVPGGEREFHDHFNALLLRPFGLNEALHGIPRPVPQDEEDLSRQLKEGESRIARAIEVIGPNLQYRGYCRVPIQHFVISDNTIYAGYCTFDREAQQEYFDQRLYMQIDRNTPLGNQFIKQFEAMWSEGLPPTVSDT